MLDESTMMMIELIGVEQTRTLLREKCRDLMK